MCVDKTSPCFRWGLIRPKQDHSFLSCQHDNQSRQVSAGPDLFENNFPPFLHCREVLNSILNPNLPLGEAVYDPEEQVEEVQVEEDSKEILDAEKEAVQAAEKGDLSSALTLFDKVTLLWQNMFDNFKYKSPSRISDFPLFNRPL